MAKSKQNKRSEQSKELRVRGLRRKQIDADQIALAYVLLAQSILAADPADAELEIEGEANEESVEGSDRTSRRSRS